MARRLVPILTGILVAAVTFVGSSQGAGSGKAAIAHIKHVTSGWKDTPGKIGLSTTMADEAMIAEKHAGFAASKPDDLEWMQKHVRHVRHAIDASTETAGPGKGYGVIKAAEGVAKHINFASGSADASDNLKKHAVHVSTSANNVVSWSNRIIILSENVLAAKAGKKKEVAAAAKWVKAIHETTKQIVNGTDANGDGKVSWSNGEGGIAQAKQHIGFIKKGEGM